VKVWISYASFEAEPIPIPRALREEEEGAEEESETKVVEGDPVLAQQVFGRGYMTWKARIKE
jgi:crooked neck